MRSTRWYEVSRELSLCLVTPVTEAFLTCKSVTGVTPMSQGFVTGFLGGFERNISLLCIYCHTVTEDVYAGRREKKILREYIRPACDTVFVTRRPQNRGERHMTTRARPPPWSEACRHPGGCLSGGRRDHIERRRRSWSIHSVKLSRRLSSGVRRTLSGAISTAITHGCGAMIRYLLLASNVNAGDWRSTSVHAPTSLQGKTLRSERRSPGHYERRMGDGEVPYSSIGSRDVATVGS